MYEQFRNQLLVGLMDEFNGQDISRIMSVIDAVSTGYDIKNKCVDIVPYQCDIPDVCKFYIASKSVEGLAKSTLELYKQRLTTFFSTVKKNPQDVSTNDIRAFLFYYQKNNNVSNRTLNTYRQILAGFFAWASTCEYIKKNPCLQIKSIKYQKKPRKAMQQIDLQYIRKACRNKKERAIVECLYSTGCRITELSSINKNDIDWNNKRIDIIGKGRKYRTVYLNAKAVFALKEYIESRIDDNEPLFVTERSPHNRIGKSGLELIVRNIYKRTQCDVSVPVSPHVFRHTTATVAIQNGMPVQDVQYMLGHSNINTTMIYAEVLHSQVETMHRKCVV